MWKNAKSFGAVVFLFFTACATRQIATPSASTLGAASFDERLNQGISFFEQDEYGEAAARFKEAVALNEKSAQAHRYLGMSYFRLKDYDSAVGQLERAASLDPSLASVYNNLGALYCIKHQYEKARDNFKKALAIAPDAVPTNYNLGTLLLSLGETEEGSTYLLKGIKLDPDYLDKHKEFATILPSALLSTPQTYFTYARLYASAGDVEKTVDYLKKARQAGFTDWKRIIEEKEFEKVRDDPRVLEFLKLI